MTLPFYYIDEQATEWFTIIHNAIENSRYTEDSERGLLVEFGILIIKNNCFIE